MVVIYHFTGAAFVALFFLQLGVEGKVYEEYESLTKNEVLKWAIPLLKVHQSYDFVTLKAEIIEYRSMGFQTLYIYAIHWTGEPQKLCGFLQRFANWAKFLIEVTPRTEVELGDWSRIAEGQQAISVYFNLHEIRDSSFNLEPDFRSNSSSLPMSLIA